jgi:hypothetical protein
VAKADDEDRVSLRDRIFGARRVYDPALDDPEHDDGEPVLTDEDLAGRTEDSETIEAHVNLKDDER